MTQIENGKNIGITYQKETPDLDMNQGLVWFG